MATVTDAFSRPEEFGSLAREIAAQLARPANGWDGRANGHDGVANGRDGIAPWPAAVAMNDPIARPGLTNVLSSVTRVADQMAGMKVELSEALDRAERAESRVAVLELDLTSYEQRIDAAALEHDAECARLRQRLFDAQSRADQAEENLQQLLRVVLDKLKP